MSQQPKQRTKKQLKSFAILLRNTTWKCGRVERQVVNYLRSHLTRFGHVRLPLKEVLSHFKLDGKRKNDFLEAIKRLERRHIIKIVQQ
ncbi:MAG: hypothetical protein JSW72_04225 [Candidatus Bathyarchaeota archaeon]|nr:MAG: hypothetical protein JSW72_04225 [Candidatus Bathyarchaeota archaeon]